MLRVIGSCGILHVAASNGNLMQIALAELSTEQAGQAAARCVELFNFGLSAVYRSNNAGVTPLMIAASVASDGSTGVHALKQLLIHGGAR